MWLSNETFPQEIVFKLSNMKQKPLIIRGFGIYCSKSISFNPKIIEVLYLHKNKQKYISLGNFKLSLSVGTQILTTEEILFKDIDKIKFIIKEAYGGNKTYINNIYLYEYLPTNEFSMSYQNDYLDLDDENNINSNIHNISNKLPSIHVRQSTGRCGAARPHWQTSRRTCGGASGRTPPEPCACVP